VTVPVDTTHNRVVLANHRDDDVLDRLKRLSVQLDGLKKSADILAQTVRRALERTDSMKRAAGLHSLAYDANDLRIGAHPRDDTGFELLGEDPASSPLRGSGRRPSHRAPHRKAVH
jgi:hypothetical protein